ncbi:TPA: LOW QUALITY PROTEIN: hypothetical protein N0F65_008081 [Lagenidium giganteum]|uniref:Ribonuclease H2 subunit B wHTH domain-containing protein n=1 Tax=Lagenidium giganteum TaxID=4803 RepID=A0AAV2Z0T6_9STRA|nr:TPA: LOW QUALITY PROTEIN: hypothetical protein N0F65_008081 [Lagenidium giganteum]
MGVLLVPRDEDVSKKLQRFQSDATDKPMYTFSKWSEGDDRLRIVAIDASGRLLEMQRVGEQGTRSWFVDTHVQKDGTFVVMTRMDALFVLLSTCWSHRERYQSLYDMLSKATQLWWLRAEACNAQSIARICDIQPGTEDEAVDNLYIKANEDKIMAWLSAKVSKLTTVLAKHASAAKAAQGDGFNTAFTLPDEVATKSSESAVRPEDDPVYIREAVGLLSEYLAPHWVEKLRTKYKCDERCFLAHRYSPRTHNMRIQMIVPVPTSASQSDQLDTFRRFDVRGQQDQSKRSAAAAASASTAPKKKSKLANVDTKGMKTMMSFFGKK